MKKEMKDFLAECKKSAGKQGLVVYKLDAKWELALEAEKQGWIVAPENRKLIKPDVGVCAIAITGITPTGEEALSKAQMASFGATLLAIVLGFISLFIINLIKALVKNGLD